MIGTKLTLMAKRGAYTRRGTNRMTRAELREVAFTKTKLFGRAVARETERFFAERGLEAGPTASTLNTIGDHVTVKRFVRYEPAPDGGTMKPNDGYGTIRFAAQVARELLVAERRGLVKRGGAMTPREIVEDAIARGMIKR